MRRLPKILSILILFSGLLHCSPEEELSRTQKGTLQLSFSTNSTKNARIFENAELPDIVYAVVTIENESGTTVVDGEKIELFKLDSEYLTKPIALLAGMNTLVDLFIIDEENNVLLVAPKEGSAMAEYVQDPLPISFIISKDEVAKIPLEVVAVDGHTSQDFGYATFSFQLVETFLISTLGLNDDGNYELIAPNILLIHDSDTVYKTIGKEGITIIPYSSTDSAYNLVVYQRGYERYGQVFTADSLQYYRDTPLVVALDPAFTFEADYVPSSVPNYWKYLNITVRTNGSSSFTIDNGYDKVDVSNGKIDLFPEEEPTPGYNFISISGDLEKITYLFDGYHTSRSTDFSRLPNLQTLYVGGFFCGEINRTIDFSNNKKLKSVFLQGIHDCDSLIFPSQKELEELTLWWSSVSEIEIANKEQLIQLWIADCVNLQIIPDLAEFPNLISIDLFGNDFNQVEVDNTIKGLYHSLLNYPRKNGSLNLALNASPSSEGLDYISKIKKEFMWEVSL